MSWVPNDGVTTAEPSPRLVYTRGRTAAKPVVIVFREGTA
jgi:hypothetical protein